MVILRFSDLRLVAETSPSSAEKSLRRDVPRDDTFAEFHDCRLGDVDLARLTGTISSCLGLEIEVYVMSYGVTAEGAPLWSERAVFLGSITIPVP